MMVLQRATHLERTVVPRHHDRIGWFERALTHSASRPGTPFRQGWPIMDGYQKETA
jgi:hypothetical protein